MAEPQRPSHAPGVIDRDEYGQPVRDRYRRLGAGSARTNEQGIYVRFEPGFGCNVHIGFRSMVYATPEDHDGIAMSLDGWERLCELVDEWRARNDG